MKRFSLVLLLLVMTTVGLIISGCGGEKAEEKAPEQARETAKETTPEKVFELKYSDQSPEAIIVGQVNKKAAQMIEEQSNGRIKITTYFSGSLIPPADTYLGVAKGTADIAWYTVGTTQGAQTLNNIFTLPFTSPAPVFTDVHKVYKQLLKEFPELDEENIKQGVKWVSFMAMPGNNFSMVKKPIRVPNDLKGMKVTIASNTPVLISMLKPVGVAIVPSDITTTYTNLERGLSEGLLFHFPAKDALKYNDSLRYHTLIGKGGISATGTGYIINLNTWNSLPPDLQKIVTDVYDWAAEELTKHNYDIEQKTIQKIVKEGHTIIELTPEESAKWYELAKPEVDKWIAQNEAKGLPAKKIYDRYLELLKQY